MPTVVSVVVNDYLKEDRVLMGSVFLVVPQHIGAPIMSEKLEHSAKMLNSSPVKLNVTFL